MAFTFNGWVYLPVFTAFQVRVIRRTAAWDWLFWVNKRWAAF